MTDNKIIFDSESNIWTSPKSTSLFDRTTSIGHIALSMMRAQPIDRVCQISDTENTTLTYGQACDYGIQIAKYLKEIGLNDEDVVGFVAPNTTFLMPAILGCWLNCTPVHLVSATNNEEMIKNVFAVTKPKLVFCDGLVYESLKDIPTRFYTLCNHLESVPKLEDIFKQIKISPLFKPVKLKYGGDQTMVIFCSSGTTGLPKCVPLSNYRFLLSVCDISSSNVIYAMTDPAWVSSLLTLACNMLFGSKRIITTQIPTDDDIINLIKKYKITHMFSSPTRVLQFAGNPDFSQTNLPSLIWIFITGSQCSIAKLEIVRKSLPNTLFVHGYGCSEFGGISYNENPNKMGVLGKIFPDIQLKILDLDSKKALKHNETGEIYLKSMLEKWIGYIGNEKATRDVINDEGWFNTGDVGYMDEENILHFVDRCKDVLKYNLYQFSLTEIEETINELDGVKDVCVFGVRNEDFWDLAAAAIVKDENSNLTETEIIVYVEKRLVVKHKCLNYGVFFVEEIFRNANGKVLRNKMRDFCLERKK